MDMPDAHPLDTILRARLHLGRQAQVLPVLIRRAMSAMDAVGRTFGPGPFFALRECEAILQVLAGRTGMDLVDAVLELQGGTRFAPHGLSHIPSTGPLIVAATHPTGVLEFFAHMRVLSTLRPDVRVVANADTGSFLGPDLIIPVAFSRDRRARSGQVTRDRMAAHLSAGGALLMFGSGRVADRVNGYLHEPDWRGGPSQVSAVAEAPVIPAALDARNSDRYYRTRARVRRLTLGNDHTAAMIGSLRYLAELLDKLGGTYDVHYGARQPPGSDRATLKRQAEALVPGLYAPPPGASGSNSSD